MNENKNIDPISKETTENEALLAAPRSQVLEKKGPESIKTPFKKSFFEDTKTLLSISTGFLIMFYFVIAMIAMAKR